MAKKKKTVAKKKTAKKKVAKKTSKKTSLKKGGKATDLPGQQALEGMEDVKVAAIEKILSSIAKINEVISQKKFERSSEVLKIPSLMKKNSLSQYSGSGYMVKIKKGEDSVVLGKVKSTKK